MNLQSLFLNPCKKIPHDVQLNAVLNAQLHTIRVREEKGNPQPKIHRSKRHQADRFLLSTPPNTVQVDWPPGGLEMEGGALKGVGGGK